MAPDTPPDRLPTGIDLGNGTTVAAVFDGQETHVPGCAGAEAGVPTRLAITADGFLVGDAAVEADVPTVRLLPHERSTADGDCSPDDAEGALPLATFLRLVLEEFVEGTHRDTDIPPRTDPDRPGAVVSEERGARPTGDGNAAEETVDGDRSSNLSESDARGTGEDPAPTVLTVPGAYTRTDIELVERAAKAAGIEDPHVVRSPVAIAAAELLGDPPSEPWTVAVADIGVEWCDLALANATPDGTIEVIARESVPECGREAFDTALAAWAIDDVATDHGASVELTRDAMATVSAEAHRVLDEVTMDEPPPTLVAEVDEGVDVVQGGWLGAGTLVVDVDVDLYACYEALEDCIKDVRDRFDKVLSAAGVVVDDIDDVLIAGNGTTPTPIVYGIEDFFGQAATPPSGESRYTAPASGAARLAGAIARGRTPITAETLDKTVELRVLGPDGPEFDVVTSSSTTAGSRCSRRVQSIGQDQHRGYFEIWYHDGLRKSRHRAQSYVVSGLPTKEAGGVVLDVEMSFSEPLLDGAPSDVAITLSEEFLGGDPEPPVAVSTGDVDHPPWLAAVAYDPEQLDLQSSGEGRQSGVIVVDPLDTALDRLSDESVAEVAHRVRNKLWERGVKNDEGLESDEIGILVREFDSGLASRGVEIVDPAPGEPVDPLRHEIVDKRESEKEVGIVLDVNAPGLAIDGTVVKPARVIVADE